jgi:hypothetical protein
MLESFFWLCSLEAVKVMLFDAAQLFYKRDYRLRFEDY